MTQNLTSPPHSEAQARAYVAHLRKFKFSGAGLIAWLVERAFPNGGAVETQGKDDGE